MAMASASLIIFLNFFQAHWHFNGILVPRKQIGWHCSALLFFNSCAMVWLLMPS